MALPRMMFYVAVTYISIAGRKVESGTKEFRFPKSLDQDPSAPHC
jgi:hypothetical protein